MKKFFFLIMIVSASLQAQWVVRTSMGLNMVSMPDVRDYLNANYFSMNDNGLSQFSPAIEFGGEVGYQLKENFQLAAEFDYEYNSFSVSTFGTYTFSYQLLQPSLLGYYTINGNGFQFKFGGGIGPRFIFVTEKSNYTSDWLKYSGSGYGLVGKIDGITSLGGNFYAYLGFDLRLNFTGTISDAGGKKKINNLTNESLSSNSLSAGIKLGVAVTL